MSKIQLSLIWLASAWFWFKTAEINYQFNRRAFKWDCLACGVSLTLSLAYMYEGITEHR